MTLKQGDLSLLEHPIAQELLHSATPARLAYTWKDGTPRVVPIWFHWNGTEIVLSTTPTALKVSALALHPQVAVTIDGNEWPYKVLLLRGIARVDLVEGVTAEYAAAAVRYFGEEQGRAWVQQVGATIKEMSRILIQPTWVGLLDYVTRFPGA